MQFPKLHLESKKIKLSSYFKMKQFYLIQCNRNLFQNEILNVVNFGRDKCKK